MDEATVRQQALLYVFIAKMYAINAEVEGMRAANAGRASRGEAMAHDAQDFLYASDRLTALASRIGTEI